MRRIIKWHKLKRTKNKLAKILNKNLNQDCDLLKIDTELKIPFFILCTFNAFHCYRVYDLHRSVLNILNKNEQAYHDFINAWKLFKINSYSATVDNLIRIILLLIPNLDKNDVNIIREIINQSINYFAIENKIFPINSDFNKQLKNQKYYKNVENFSQLVSNLKKLNFAIRKSNKFDNNNLIVIVNQLTKKLYVN